MTFRAEVVGSLLRPPALVEARASARAGDLAEEQLREAEDRAVDDALTLQREAGVDVATDGEMRRAVFFEFLISGLEGSELVPRDPYRIEFHGATAEDAMTVEVPPFTAVAKLRARTCPGVREYEYARSRTELPLKVTLPSPMMAMPLYGAATREVYASPFDMLEDVAAAVKQWMRDLAAVGCTYIQIDAPELAEAYADEHVRAGYAAAGIDPDAFLSIGTEFLGDLGALPLPGVTKAMHVCKGNGTRSWIAEGGYDAFSRHVFSRAAGFDVFLMEYDDARSGGFEPLANVDDDKTIALGLVSTKWTELEDADELVRRIDEAARFHPRDRLAICTQCGFASAAETAAQRKITEQTQRDKLDLVARVARHVWG